jgi:signal peptidase I
MHYSKPRKPIFALLMSFVLPGFGQLYNGELNKAIWLFIAFALLSIPGVVLIALYLPSAWMLPALAFGLLSTLGLWLFGMVDAWRVARRRQEYEPLGWQISGVYALVFILCNLVALPLLTGYVREHQVEAFRVPSASMEPGIEPGDFIFADKRYNHAGWGYKQAVERGDVAIFTYPNNRTLYYIKRVIGLPGDHIQIKGEDVFVNGRSLTIHDQVTQNGNLITERAGDKQWQVRWTKPSSTELDVTVPPGQVFFLGDNRSLSKDSREIGTVSLQDVVGRARQIWFSLGKDGVRWKRLGRVLQ